MDAANLRRSNRPSEKHGDLEKVALRPHEEIAGLAREHDRIVRRVDALVAKLGGRLAQALPRVTQIVGELLRQRGLGRRPTVVRLAFLDPLLAVIALASGHERDRSNAHGAMRNREAQVSFGVAAVLRPWPSCLVRPWSVVRPRYAR